MPEPKTYFITVFQSYDEYGPHNGRCWGYYFSWDDAYEVLHNNRTDLWETCYHYAVIEEYTSGINTHTGRTWFFMYDRKSDKYEMTDIPPVLKHFSSFSIG